MAIERRCYPLILTCTTRYSCYKLRSYIGYALAIEPGI
jgi:hypothetical protein